MDTKSQKPAILITGIEGLIGSNLAKWILDNHPEYEVVGLDAELGGLEENLDPRIKAFYKLDLTKHFKAIDKFVFEEWKPVYVFHMAAFAAEGLSPFMRKCTHENNLVATATVIDLCIKHKAKLVFASSMAVYGESFGKRYDEKDPCNPLDPYGVSKLACEADIKIACKQHGLEAVILRPHNVYGPGQNIFDPYRNVLGIWMHRVLHNQPITVYGDGRQERCFTYVGDIVEPIWNATKVKSGTVINLGDTAPCSLKSLATIFKEVIGKERKVSIQYLEKRYEVKQACPDGYLSRQLLGFEQTTGLREGIKKMWDWAKTLPDRELQYYNEYELDKGIYSYWKVES